MKTVRKSYQSNFQLEQLKVWKNKFADGKYMRGHQKVRKPHQPLENVFRSTRKCISHICLRQMCLGALEGAYAIFALANVFRSTGRSSCAPPQGKQLQLVHLMIPQVQQLQLVHLMISHTPKPRPYNNIDLFISSKPIILKEFIQNVHHEEVVISIIIFLFNQNNIIRFHLFDIYLLVYLGFIFYTFICRQ